MNLQHRIAALIQDAVDSGEIPTEAEGLHAVRQALEHVGSANHGVSTDATRSMDREDLLEALFRSTVSYAIVITDLSGSVVAWNAGAVLLLEWTFAEMDGKPADIFFTPEDLAAGVPHQEMLQALEKGHAADERWHIRKSGDRFWGSGEMMPLIDAPDSVIGFVKIVREGKPGARPG
jgi:PAS domain S-box-containing protein